MRKSKKQIKKNPLGRVCPICKKEFIYVNEKALQIAIKNNKCCQACARGSVETQKRVEQLEIDGSLVCDITGTWTLTCKVCGKIARAKKKTNVITCRGCNPQEKTSNTYWPLSLDQIIQNYNKTENEEERNKIYEQHLHKPFRKLVENIFNTFKFSYFETGPLEIQEECVNHCVGQLAKYDPIKGKSYSYFSLVAKNYLIALNNTTYKKFNREDSIDLMNELKFEGEPTHTHHKELQVVDDSRKDFQLQEFMRLFTDWFDENIPFIFRKDRDIAIANAITEVFRRSNSIDIDHKKAIYLIIREISGCKTSHITRVCNEMKLHYRKLYQYYLDYGTLPETRQSICVK